MAQLLEIRNLLTMRNDFAYIIKQLKCRIYTYNIIQYNITCNSFNEDDIYVYILFFSRIAVISKMNSPLQNSNSSITQSMFFDQSQLEQFVQITSTPIKKIISYNLSLNRLKTIVTTAKGFCVINNTTKKFKKFQDEHNPFYIENNNNNSTQGNYPAISLGSILEQRPQVALIPKRSSKHYSNTTVYIFDYSLKTILYSNDFFLPIRQITLTDQSIIVSNNKRIIIYDYKNDHKEKNQKYYLQLYQQNNQQNNSLRYFQMFCQEKFSNNSIFYENEVNAQDNQPIQLLQPLSQRTFCKCGQYAITAQKPYKIVYTRVYTINGRKRISLVIYDYAIDKDYVFQSMQYSDEFTFSISQDGQFLAYSENEGRTVKIHKVGTQGSHQTFKVSRSFKKVCAQGFFKARQNLWYTIIRKEGNNNGHMHIFKISADKTTEPTQSQYKRYFSLYDKTFKDYGISEGVIGPDYYIHNDVLYSFSLCGIVHDVIDFKRTGNHPKKIAENFIKWNEDDKY